MGRARELANLFSGGSADINVKTSDGGILNLQTSDTTVTQDSVVGSIQFQAPDEASGTDSILVASKIEAVAEGTFSASSNATSLVFSTASSAAAGTVAGKMTFTSGGELVIKDTDTADGSSPTITLQSGDTDIAQDDVLGSINFQAPDEGTGTDAILVAAGIAAVSEGDFSSSSNATKLSFKTGASEAAAEKMSLSSAGLLTVSGRIITDDTTDATSTTDGSLQTDGGLSVAKDAVIGDDLLLKSDVAEIKFGADSEVSLIHYHDNGLKLKTNATGDDTFPSLTLQTGQTDIQQDDTLGRIQFQAPDEGTGTDAILIAAEIEAVSEGDFAADNNATTLNFRTGASEGAGVKMKLTSTGRLGIGTTLSETTEELTVKGAGTVASFVGTGGNGAIAIRDDDDSTLAFAVVDGGTFKIQTSGNSYSDKFKIDPTGFVNMPETAAFSVQASDMANIAINNSTTIQFDQEIFDQNADFNTSNYTFTAPITGRYMLNVNVRMDNVDAAHTYAYMILNTSNRVYEYLVDLNQGGSADHDYMMFIINVLADMDTSDTAYVQMHIPNAGSAQSDIVGSQKCTFSGFLAC